MLRALWLAGVFLIAGCAEVALESQPPDRFDLAGTWTLVEDQSETPPAPRRLGARGTMLPLITQDFPVLRAEQLRIEQSADSIGIYYDGRDYRDVSWGVRQRGLWEVRAGWNEGRLLIISNAPDADAQETLSLSPDGRTLRVDVDVESRGSDISLTRVYRR